MWVVVTQMIYVIFFRNKFKCNLFLLKIVLAVWWYQVCNGVGVRCVVILAGSGGCVVVSGVGGEGGSVYGGCGCGVCW